MNEIEQKHEELKNKISQLLYKITKLEKEGKNKDEIQELKQTLEQLRKEYLNCKMELTISKMGNRQR